MKNKITVRFAMDKDGKKTRLSPSIRKFIENSPLFQREFSKSFEERKIKKFTILNYGTVVLSFA